MVLKTFFKKECINSFHFSLYQCDKTGPINLETIKGNIKSTKEFKKYFLNPKLLNGIIEHCKMDESIYVEQTEGIYRLLFKKYHYSYEIYCVRPYYS